MKNLRNVGVAMYFASRRFREFLVKDSGSASVEFVLLAVPLFLPILIFLNQFAVISNSELVARTLVRESLRAYVTSETPNSAPDRANQVLRSAAKAQGLTANEINSLNLTFQCSQDPCLTPNGRIRATLKMRLEKESRQVIAEAEEYLSPWQWTGYVLW